MCKGKKYTVSDVSKAERHNERKNETYENINMIEERIPYNVHFKKPFAPTYMEQLKQMEADGMVSLRRLKKDATLFNEIAIKCKDGFDNKWNNKYGQKNIDIRPTARYNIVNLIRKPSDHCYEAES